jgi:hypothetical protein
MRFAIALDGFPFIAGVDLVYALTIGIFIGFAGSITWLGGCVRQDRGGEGEYHADDLEADHRRLH